MPRASKKEADAQERSFEALLEELGGVVERMESGELTLGQAMEVFERGIKLAGQCERMLTDAQLRVEELSQAAGQSRESEDADEALE